MAVHSSGEWLDSLIQEILGYMMVFRVDYTAGIDKKENKQKDVLAFDFGHAENVVLSITGILAKDGFDDEERAQINSIAVLVEDCDFAFVGNEGIREFDEFSSWNMDLAIYELGRQFCEAFEAEQGGLENVAEKLRERDRKFKEFEEHYGLTDNAVSAP